MVTVVEKNNEEMDARCVEVMKRIDQGELQKDLAKEYDVSLMTIWRWHNRALQMVLPDIHSREQWQTEIAMTLADRIRVAKQTGDDKALAMLADRFAKLLGLDHSDKVNEALMRIEAAKLDLLAGALARALDDAGVEVGTRAKIAEALDSRLAELETT